MKTYFFEHLGPDIEWAQCEAAGLCLRLGRNAWVFGRYDYREKTCPWPTWLRFNLSFAPFGVWALGRRWR